MSMDKVRVRSAASVHEGLLRSGVVSETDVNEALTEHVDAVRAYRLAEIRKQQGVTQQNLADQMIVAQSRISAIENGDLQHTELGTVSAYVEALGGHLRVVADFGDQQLTVAG